MNRLLNRIRIPSYRDFQIRAKLRLIILGTLTVAFAIVSDGGAVE